jgi:hypothetical protein
MICSLLEVITIGGLMLLPQFLLNGGYGFSFILEQIRMTGLGGLQKKTIILI